MIDKHFQRIACKGINILICSVNLQIGSLQFIGLIDKEIA
jgi:hypothetical protein